MVNNPGKQSRLTRTIALWLGLLLPLMLTTAVAIGVHRLELGRAHDRFEAEASLIQERIAQRINAHEQVLMAAAEFATNDQLLPSREGFRRYVKALELDRLNPGVQALGFSEWIPLPGLKAHEARLKAEGFPDYQVRPGGPLPPDGGVSSIIYIEPFDVRNQRAFSRDMYAEANRREAMGRARDTGRVSLSGPVKLYQEGIGKIQVGALLYAPVYRFGYPRESVAQRREAHVAWTYMAFRMDDLLEGITGDSGQGIHLELFDGTAELPPNLLFHRKDQPLGSTPTWTARRQFQVAGRVWTLKLTPGPAYGMGIAAGTPLIILLVGLFTSIGVFVYLLVLTRSERIANSLAEERLKILQSLLNTIPDLVFFKNLEGLYLSCNPPMLELFGQPKEAVLDHTDFDLVDESSAEICRQQDLLVLAGKATLNNDNWLVYPDGRKALFDILKTPFYSPSGELVGILGIGRDITSRKVIEEVLVDRDQLLSAVSQALVLLLDAPDWEGVLPDFLTHLGEGAKASRAYIFKRDSSGTSDVALKMCPIGEWSAEGIGSSGVLAASVAQVSPMSDSGFLRWVEEVGANPGLAGFTVDLPPSEQPLLLARGIHSFLMAPIFVRRNLWGMIGFDECTGLRTWSGPEQDILRLTARALGTVIERQEARNALETTKAALEQRVVLRTRDLQSAVLELTTEVATRHRAEDRLTGLTEGFLRFGPNPQVNLSILLRLFQDLTRADQVLYLSVETGKLEFRSGLPGSESAQLLLAILRDLDPRTLIRNTTVSLDCPESGSGQPSILRAQGVWAEEQVVGVLVGGCSPATIWSTEDDTVLSILAAAAGIEERRRLSEENHRKSQLQLLQAQKLESVGRMAAGIAHEINTPIQFVSMNLRFLDKTYAQLLQVLAQAREAPQVPAIGAQDLAWIAAETPQVIQDSIEGIERVATIVRAMKEFSHPGNPHPVTLDINNNLESAVNFSRNEWKYGAELHLEVDHALPVIQGFPAELNQVFLNLIINAVQAIKAKPHAEGQLGSICISTSPTGTGVEIRIKDSGTGILPEHEGKVFDPFFTTKGVGIGTGQGLSVCYQTVVHLHGGELFFETNPGLGTTFIVRLPFRPVTRMDSSGQEGSA